MAHADGQPPDKTADPSRSTCGRSRPRARFANPPPPGRRRPIERGHRRRRWDRSDASPADRGRPSRREQCRPGANRSRARGGREHATLPVDRPTHPRPLPGPGDRGVPWRTRSTVDPISRGCRPSPGSRRDRRRPRRSMGTPCRHGGVPVGAASPRTADSMVLQQVRGIAVVGALALPRAGSVRPAGDIADSPASVDDIDARACPNIPGDAGRRLPRGPGRLPEGARRPPNASWPGSGIIWVRLDGIRATILRGSPRATPLPRPRS